MSRPDYVTPVLLLRYPKFSVRVCALDQSVLVHVNMKNGCKIPAWIKFVMGALVIRVRETQNVHVS